MPSEHDVPDNLAVLSDQDIDELLDMAPEEPVDYDDEPVVEQTDLALSPPDMGATHWSGWWSTLEFRIHSPDVRVWRGAPPSTPPAFSRSAPQVAPGYAWLRMDAPAGGTGNSVHGFLVPASLLAQAGVWGLQWEPIENGRTLRNTLKIVARNSRHGEEVVRVAYVTPDAATAPCWSSLHGSTTHHFTSGTRPTVVNGRFLLPTSIFYCLTDLGDNVRDDDMAIYHNNSDVDGLNIVRVRRR